MSFARDCVAFLVALPVTCVAYGWTFVAVGLTLGGATENQLSGLPLSLVSLPLLVLPFAIVAAMFVGLPTVNALRRWQAMSRASLTSAGAIGGSLVSGLFMAFAMGMGGAELLGFGVVNGAVAGVTAAQVWWYVAERPSQGDRLDA